MQSTKITLGKQIPIEFDPHLPKGHKFELGYTLVADDNGQVMYSNADWNTFLAALPGLRAEYPYLQMSVRGKPTGRTIPV